MGKDATAGQRPKRLKKKCCLKYQKKGKYCKRCPVYWALVAKERRGG